MVVKLRTESGDPRRVCVQARILRERLRFLAVARWERRGVVGDVRVLSQTSLRPARRLSIGVGWTGNALVRQICVSL
jgi:hypothetical protein